MAERTLRDDIAGLDYSVTDQQFYEMFTIRCVERPSDLRGGYNGPVGQWIYLNIDPLNVCWLSVTERASHLAFRHASDAERFREFLAEYEIEQAMTAAPSRGLAA
ncbi:hypothetical protein ACFOY8_11820 [Thalassospira xianhensis]|nr:hypothetical protein [Thalassospira xianhensis]